MPINLVQKFIVQVDSMELLEKYLRLAMTTVLESQDELAVKILNHDGGRLSLELPPTISDFTDKRLLPVILIGGWFLPKEGEKNSYFSGYGPWTTFRFDGRTSAVSAAMQHITELLIKHKKDWAELFINNFGNGYDGDDVSVEIGYEIRDCGHFPEWLAISLVHIYYKQ